MAIDDKLKSTILNELFDDLEKTVNVLDNIHKKQDDWINNLEGIANDVTNQIADKVSNIVLLDVKNAEKSLISANVKLEESIKTINKMGVSITSISKKIESEKINYSRNYFLIAITVFLLTNFFNFLIFNFLSK